MSDARPGRILIVEDEPAIRDVVTTALRFHGHTITETGHGRDGLELATGGGLDLIVLDVMLPGLDGFEVCRQLRDRGIATPILFLTARDEPDDRIRGFVSGGDDYLTKPFSVDELVLRVDAILRRTRDRTPSDLLVVGDVTLDPDSHEVRRAGRLIDLSPTEFNLLHYLMTNRGVVVSKTQIVMNVWDYDYDGSDNVVEVYVGYLRRKLEADAPPIIHTRRGAGYMLRAEGP